MSTFDDFNEFMMRWDPNGDQNLWATLWYARMEELAMRLFMEDARLLLEQCVWRQTDEGYKLVVDEFNVPVTEMYMEVREGARCSWYQMHTVSMASDLTTLGTPDLEYFAQEYADLVTWDSGYTTIMAVGHERILSKVDESTLWTLLHALHYLGADTPWAMKPSLWGPRVSASFTPRRMHDSVVLKEDRLADLNSAKRRDAWGSLVKRLGHEPEAETTLPSEEPYWVREYRHEIPEEPFPVIVDRPLPVWSVPKDQYAARAYALEERRAIRMGTTCDLITLEPARWKRCYVRSEGAELVGLGWTKDVNGKWVRTRKYSSYNEDFFATGDRGVQRSLMGVLRHMVETGQCLVQLESRVAKPEASWPKERWVRTRGGEIQPNPLRELDRIDGDHIAAFCPSCQGKGEGAIVKETKRGKQIRLAPMYEDIHADVCLLCGAEVPQMVLNCYVETTELSMLVRDLRRDPYYVKVQVFGREVKRMAEASEDLVRVPVKRRFNDLITGKFEWRIVNVEKSVPWYVAGRHQRSMRVRVAHQLNGGEDLIQTEMTSSWL